MIRCQVLLNCVTDEVKASLVNQGVIDVKRMTEVRDSKRYESLFCILAFNTLSLP